MIKNIFFVMLAICSLSVTSCKKDVEGCTDPLADNYNPEADVDSGNCIPARDKFLGSYNNLGDCDGDTYEYIMGIVPSADAANEVSITNILAYGTTVRGIVTGNTIEIPTATFYSTGQIVGSGVINGNVLTINITVSEGTYTLNCVLTGTKI